MKKIAACIFILAFNINTANSAVCPTDAVLSVECNVGSALTHIKNKHCKTPGKGAEQFSKYYCTNLIQACLVATEVPDASYPNNCYKKGEDGEIVGYTSDGKPTNCYHVNFESGKGIGTMKLKTMYPDQDKYCTQK